ncbi:MAG: hypothetical protein H0U48_06795 [Euzebyaceae bacterium]|jgi:hypothetical protein|nr:hypothetical protein [Euzebyaceae bacterium]
MDEPDFGPRGYLPQRAARRARKIVLREQMGRSWLLAAFGATALVAVAGLVFVLVAGRAPGEPFSLAGLVDRVAQGDAGMVGNAFVIRGGGSVRAFVPPKGEVQWCAQTDRLEAADGRVWTADGRLVGGRGRSLTPLRSTVFQGTLFVDHDTPLPSPAPDDRGAVPGCG